MHILTLSILIWNNENIFTFYFIVSGSVVHWISFHLCISPIFYLSMVWELSMFLIVASTLFGSCSKYTHVCKCTLVQVLFCVVYVPKIPLGSFSGCRLLTRNRELCMVRPSIYPYQRGLMDFQHQFVLFMSNKRAL